MGPDVSPRRHSPQQPTLYVNLTRAYIATNRYEEAKAVAEQAIARQVGSANNHFQLFAIAFAQGDTAAMEREVQWAKGKPEEQLLLGAQASAAAFSGKMQQARQLREQAVEMAQRAGLKEVASGSLATLAECEALYGNLRPAREQAAAALALARRFPTTLLLHAVRLPVVRAALVVQRGNAAKAVEMLRPAAPYEAGSSWPAYVRGLAHLRNRAPAEAAAEFQKILDHRGVSITSPLYPLAHLGAARAWAQAGDAAKSRRLYQDLLALWKDADPDLRVLREARQEYEKLR